MKTKIYKMSTRRAYKNRQLVDGFDMEGEFDNFGNKPKMMVKLIIQSQIKNELF